MFNTTQQNIAREIHENSNISHWKDWKWQVKHSIRNIQEFERLTKIKFKKNKVDQLEKTLKKFPLSITPYYLSLIDVNNYENDPVFKQSFPQIDEINIHNSECKDPLSEEHDSPVKGIIHRYPDRVLFHVSNICSIYCRHCTRKRKVGDVDYVPSKTQLKKGINYIQKTPQIRDVLLSGGDPLMLHNDYLDWLLNEIRSIPHVEIIRIGTRMPVVLPYRITDSLVSMLKKYQPLWINTQFNHPREITASSKESLARLANAGFPLGNQTVLLADINDCPRIMKKLVHKLVQNRVRPYYLYQCDLAEGLFHFRTPIGKGIEIMESLIGHTTGFAVPTYVIDAPGGGGKIPIMPNYIISWSTYKIILRNYEGVITTYKEPENYESRLCNRDCDNCKLELNIDEADEVKSVGIEKLISDSDSTISLIPANNDRHNRRKNNA